MRTGQWPERQAPPWVRVSVLRATGSLRHSPRTWPRAHADNAVGAHHTRDTDPGRGRSTRGQGPSSRSDGVPEPCTDEGLGSGRQAAPPHPPAGQPATDPPDGPPEHRRQSARRADGARQEAPEQTEPGLATPTAPTPSARCPCRPVLGPLVERHPGPGPRHCRPDRCPCSQESLFQSKGASEGAV